MNHDVKIRNASDVENKEIQEEELLAIGTPVHGYLLFGQKPAQEIRELLGRLPEDLGGKPVVSFATYMLFAGKALDPIKRAVETRNGKLVVQLAERRTRKQKLVEAILGYVNSSM